MNIQQLPLGPFAANCYFIEAENAAAVIDPGYPDNRLRQWALAHKDKLQYILLTHCHCDHICGAEELRQLTGAPVCIGASDADGYNNDRLNLVLQTGGAYKSTAEYAAPDILLHDGDVLPFGGTEIRCLHTPGHTLGGGCFMIENVLFTGDTLFENSIGRTDFYGGSFSELKASLKKIVEICGNRDYSIYSGHGASTTLKQEKLCNPYLVNL